MTDSNYSSDPGNKGVEGLTEILRVQAEALSRISERMAGLNLGVGNPPPASSRKIPNGDGQHLPALAGDPSLHEESLPVLNSFKKFLDQERRRGRKRFIWGLFGVTVVFSCVIAAIVMLNSVRVKSLKTDIIQTSSRLDRSRLETESELKKVSDKTAQAAMKSAATMSSNITRNILWAHSVLASNMTTELTDRDSQIERLKEKVSTLEVDNTMLSHQVAELVQRVQIIEADYLDTLEHPVTENRRPDADEAVSNAAAVAARAAPVTINSTKLGRSMQMKMPKE